jgi:enediyne biosynthesis thioesterase
VQAPDTQKWLEYHHEVTFVDTNMVGNVYFATYFMWMGKCRDLVMAEHYPKIKDHIREGFGFATEHAHIDFLHETFLFDKVCVRMTISGLTRTRIEFIYEFVNTVSKTVLAKGSQAVVWVNTQHRPSLMPDELYAKACEFSGFTPE